MTTNKKLIIEQKVNELVAEEVGIFLVSVKIDAKNNVKVFLDGDAGISIGQCTQINRGLYPFIETSGIFPNDDFSLEVSSAGVDEPLLLVRQYIKNIGRDLEVVTNQGEKLGGKLLIADEKTITLEQKKGKGKKMEVVQTVLSMDEIKTATVQINF
jgi:ribosome maturation factor RimP